MSKERVAEKETSVQMAYNSWHQLLYNKLYNLEYFLLAVKSDLRAAGLTSAKADEMIEEKIQEIRAEIRSTKNQIYTRQK